MREGVDRIWKAAGIDGSPYGVCIRDRPYLAPVSHRLLGRQREFKH